MTRLWLAAAITGLLIGCGDRAARTLGADVEGASISIAFANQTNIDSFVIVHGTLTKKCPVAGCWFFLRDQSGTIKVDTKNAGFVVTEVPLNATLRVAGRVVTNGSERLIDATGARY